MTTVELSDREIQFIQRALCRDDTNNDENGTLHGAFTNMMIDLDISWLDYE